MKTLLIEDNTISRLVLEEQLHSLGCEVSACPDAEAALEAYQQTFYPLIVLDLGLPGMDGLEFSRHIRALPQGDQSMILVITAWDQPEDIQAALDAGTDDYLIKPVSIGQLLVRLTIIKRQWHNLIKRKQAEEALQKSEAFLNSIIEQSPSAMWISDDKGTLMRLNQACCDLLNIKEEEVVGKYNVLKDNIVKEQGFLSLVKSVFEEGKTVQFVIRYDSSQLKHLQLKRTTFVILDVTIFPIKDVNGRVTNAVIQYRDITRQKQAEETLQENEERFRDIVENAEAGYFFVDKDGYYRDVNTAWLRMHGYTSREEVLGKHFSITQVEVNREQAQQLGQEVLHGEPIPAGEFTRRCKDGTIKFHTFSSKPVVKNDQIIGVEGFMTDITERKKMEEEVRKHRRDLQRLSAQLINAQEAERKRISRELHDQMGQVLTAMSLNLAASRKELPSEVPSEVKERLDETHSLVDQALEQIRELSRNLRPGILDDLGLVPALRWYVNRYAKRLNIEVDFETVNLEKRLSTEIETAFYRIIQEALTNIAKHAQAKRVHIRLERKESTIAGFIEDDGQGFDVQNIENLNFSRYGMGLLGMRERAALLGGKFSIQSHPAQGTRLSVEIPIQM